MLDQWRARSDLRGRRLRYGYVFDRLTVVRFVADVGRDVTRRRESANDGEGREKPSGLSEKIVVSDGVGNAVRTRPGSSGRRRGEIAGFAVLAGGEAEIRTARTGGECLEDGGAGVVVRTCDAAGGARQSDISDGLTATEGTERILQEEQRLRARSTGLLSREGKGKGK